MSAAFHDVNAISVTRLSHTFSSQPGRKTLNDINFLIPGQQFVALVGQSGCGKTTLLRLLSGLLHPLSGNITLGGLAPEVAATRRMTAWMAQKPALLPWLTVEANLLQALRFVPAERRTSLSVEQMLALVNLTQQASVYPHQLSGGMQQRLALARLLVADSAYWLMDEPFSALDEINRTQLTRRFVDLWSEKRPAVIWVTHRISEAVALADRIIVLSPQPGRITHDRLIDLPRPRDERSSAFYTLVDEIRTILEGAGDATLS